MGGEGGGAYGEVVEVGEHEEDAEKGDEAEDDTAHWRAAARRSVDFAAPIAAKRRQSHEAPANDIGHPQRHEFAVGAQDNTLQAVAVLAVAAAEAFGRDRRLEEAEQSDQEGGAHGFADVLHVRGDERPVEGKGGAGARLHVAEDFKPLLVPATFPGKDGGENDDDEAIGYIRNRRVSRLQTSFELPKPTHPSVRHQPQMRQSNPHLQTMIMTKLPNATAHVKRCAYPAFSTKNTNFSQLLPWLTCPTSCARCCSPISGIS